MAWPLPLGQRVMELRDVADGGEGAVHRLGDALSESIAR